MGHSCCAARQGADPNKVLYHTKRQPLSKRGNDFRNFFSRRVAERPRRPLRGAAPRIRFRVIATRIGQFLTEEMRYACDVLLRLVTFLKLAESPINMRVVTLVTDRGGGKGKAHAGS